MVALAYENLGGIGGEVEGALAPYSVRGRDRDRFQNFIFECDAANPFTGTVYLQISQDSPPQQETHNVAPTGKDLTWADVAKLEFTAEAGNIFLQLEVETPQIRMIVKTGDYVSGRILNIKSMR